MAHEHLHQRVEREKKRGRTLRMMSLSSVMLSGCTQYLVVWRMKLACCPPAALSPLTGFPLVRTRS